MTKLIEIAQAGWSQHEISGSRYAPFDSRTLDAAERSAFDGGYEIAQDGDRSNKMSTISPLWTAYNNLHNEGGEGYNPHPKHIDNGGEPQWSALDDKRARLMRIMEGTSTDDQKYAVMEDEVAALTVAIEIAKKEGI